MPILTVARSMPHMALALNSVGLNDDGWLVASSLSTCQIWRPRVWRSSAPNLGVDLIRVGGRMCPGPGQGRGEGSPGQGRGEGSPGQGR
eukprot:7120430-Prymnesium_polylepis.1